MPQLSKIRSIRLQALGSLLLLAACADGQAPRANCFSFVERPSGITTSTMGPQVSQADNSCDFTPIGGAD